MSNGNYAECTGNSCGYNIDGETIICTSGDGSCFEASFLEADTSGFHDSSLATATTTIKSTLSSIPHDPGRKLAILHTNMGLLLAWVEHGIEVPPGAITSNNDDATIAAALNLKGYATQSATTSDCVGRTCGYNVYGNSCGCTTGDGSCFQALFIEAEESGFHDAALAAATVAIRNALAAIPEDVNGRKLSIVKTRMGLLLARVEHGQPVHPDAIRPTHADAAIAAALKLKGVPAAASGKAI